MKKVFLYTQEFPREYKYTLGQNMKRDAIQLVSTNYWSSSEYNNNNAWKQGFNNGNQNNNNKNNTNSVRAVRGFKQIIYKKTCQRLQSPDSV